MPADEELFGEQVTKVLVVDGKADTFEFINAVLSEGAGDAEAAHFSPPTLTKTWFHQGPIGPEFGDWREAGYSGEYWPEDPSTLLRPEELVAFLQDSNIPRRIKRDAIRSPRGSTLRTELYALDGSERQDRPYTVTESQYGVRAEDLPGPGEGERLSIVFPHLVAQRTTQWERGDEPMTSFSFTDDFEYGQPRRQIGLAVPRNRDWRVAATVSEPYLGTVTQATFAQRDDADRYIVDRVASTTSSEIINDGGQALFDLVEEVRQNTASLELFSQSLNYYDGDAFEGLPLGQLGDFGALTRSESLVLTEEILQEAYRSGDTVASPPELPPYLVPGASPNWTPEYPVAFQEEVERLPGQLGYQFQLPTWSSAAGRFTTTKGRS